MTAATGPRIAIVGAGFSGSLLAVQLLKRALPNGRVYLIEKNAQFGGGLAYSTGNARHLLNVRASRMSAFVDEPDHFTQWLRQRGETAGAAKSADTFVPRHLYGAYIQELLGNEIWQSGRGRNLHLVPDEATAIEQTPEGLTVEVGTGRRYEVDGAVLAVGNFPNEGGMKHYYGNPWDARATAALDPQAAVLLIGTGLTMVDSVISLLDSGHRGRIYAVSRRGLLPRRHGEAPAHAAAWLSEADLGSVTDLLRAVRREVRKAGDEIVWRSVVDALRPYTQQLWQGLSPDERRRFLRHLRPWWDVHRHRMAPAVADLIERTVQSGQLSLLAGRIQQLTPNEQGIEATLLRRGMESPEPLRVARVIDCSGPQCDYAAISSPLVRSLLDQGIARPDPLALGLDVTLDSAVIDRDGNPSSRLFALGPVTRGIFWEITSVPDIREQCWKVAAQLGLRLAVPQLARA
ncbi:MAG TPA: FAD/NAD(P)-binding protein [Dongiaceae bacterium]|jgi:uncharacterized NAD(P)/FAD-binding protein YdhS